MNGYTHMIVGGMTAGLVVAAAIGQKTVGFEINNHYFYPVLMVAPAIIGGLGPDVDMPNSKSGRVVRRALTFSIVGTAILLLILAVIAIIGGGTGQVLKSLGIFFVAGCGVMTFITLAKHRRETHSGILCLILFAPIVWVVTSYTDSLPIDLILSVWTGFWIGWFSHLVADSFNRKGVPWLFPLKNSKGKYTYYHIMTITTGTDEEKIFRIGAVVTLIAAYLIIILMGVM